MLYSFTGGSDGGNPSAGLLNGLNGTLYGTALLGGASGFGTVHAITPSESVTVLHSFKGGKDGAAPFAGLLIVNGTLYGTTESGGGPGCSRQGGKAAERSTR